MPPAEPDDATKRDGAPRRVGVEVEFAGLDPRAAAEAVAARLGGRVAEEDPHAFRVVDGPLPVSVSLDSRYVHPESARTIAGEIGARLAPLVGHAAGGFLPSEMVTAPLPADALPMVDEAVAALREAGARGTQDGPLCAFGLHFNPEPPDLEPATIVAHLKAYVLLEPWLRRAMHPDRTRDLLGFAAPFAPAYARLVLAEPVELPGLIDRHLAHNPTRNRGLDLLPLFAHLDAPRVRAVLPREKIGARPTFHYRLPNARVSEPGWGIGPDWARWRAVERLAADGGRLGRLAADYLARGGDPEGWAARIEAAGEP